ncbi:ABC transporter permease subunit [Cohnella nanjingensis]|uniref:ABC transporter permease subunit n=1 Tax=Cohnella nanjingensis TaxID=1387779 RepID=A0A7X0RU88_9BACL|nr:ABC transporter permease subunit [Cohnella nanjingensis]MBB6673700.1 ABC transporter permease subunit [Cohnella nanjingensis]
MTSTNTKNTETDGFARILRAEWIKFRAARGLMIGMVVALMLTTLFGLLIANTSSRGGGSPRNLLGPDGEAVTDKFYFVHQPLTGDGSITVRVTSLTGMITYPPPNHDQIVPGVVPWAKAGIIIKDSTRQGSAYAAMMVTGSHGVRMQYNFIHDTAGHLDGVSTESPRWLRLTRSDDTITGYESTDGTQWTKVGMARLAGLPAKVEIGLFVNSPGNVTLSEGKRRFTNSTAVFDRLELQGVDPGVAWSHDDIGIVSTTGPESGRPGLPASGVKESGGTFTVTGSGDIAPLGAEGSWPIERSLIGVLAGMIAVIVVATRFVTAEYGRDMIRDTQLATPRRDRVLAAKSIVIGTVTFVAGLAAAIVVIPISRQILLSNGIHILPVTLFTELRVIFGTAALLAVAAVFALALAALFQRSVVAVTASIAAIVLTYILANFLPLGMSQWLLRLTPAAGFAIQQSIPEYPQVIGLYVPQAGYYPLAPWAGFAVLCGYAALALGLAVFRLQPSTKLAETGCEMNDTAPRSRHH